MSRDLETLTLPQVEAIANRLDVNPWQLLLALEPTPLPNLDDIARMIEGTET